MLSDYFRGSHAQLLCAAQHLSESQILDAVCDRWDQSAQLITNYNLKKFRAAAVWHKA
jgi:hypothetical protein